MSDKELAPISVEVVAIDDLNSIKVIANTNTSKENNAGIGERADAFLGLASDVIDLVEGKQLYKVEVPEGCNPSRTASRFPMRRQTQARG